MRKGFKRMYRETLTAWTNVLQRKFTDNLVQQKQTCSCKKIL